MPSYPVTAQEHRFLPGPPWHNLTMTVGSEPQIGDALGAALLAHMDEGSVAGTHIVERDDGYVTADSADLYFTEIGEWFAVEESAPRRVAGRVLDIGAGGGRFAVALQGLGHDLVALDVSPGCLEVCRRRGVEQTFFGTIFELADSNPEPFDTFLLMGHNLGLLAGPGQAALFLDALRTMANPGAKILGTNRTPTPTSDPDHLAYHQLNRERGRQPGQMIIRVRWQALATPWFDYWFLPIEELEAVAGAAGWKLADRVFENEHYLAELVMAG